MDTFMNYKTGKKVFIGFATIFSILVIVVLFGILASNNLYNWLEQSVNKSLPAVDYLMQLDRDLQQSLVAERSMVFSDVNSSEFEGFLNDWKENIEQTKERWDKYVAVNELEEGKKFDDAFYKDRKSWLALTQQVVKYLQENTEESRQQAMNLSVGDAAAAFEKMRDHIDKLEEIQLSYASEIRDNAVTVNRMNMILFIVLLVIGIGIWLGLSRFIGNAVDTSINDVLNSIEDIANGIRNGKLDDRVNSDMFTPEFEPIGKGVNGIIDAFTAPINLTAEYVDRISKGDLPPLITDKYYGDFNEIKNNLNQCISVM
eukprot:Anaeramoba_ignava/a95489_7.p1 GENE.a95489_7~~a95489_7.p1  ORF type:complete len:315 (+),score=32.69 a95489_7:62-1006(+)